MKKLIALVLALALAGCILPPVNRDQDIPFGPIAAIEPERYAGRWYEIARFENAFERNCSAVTADYRIRADARIEVVNTCRQGGVSGPVETARGVARIVDEETNARLKVRFGWSPVEGDYWVLERAEDYSWSLVGEPRGRFLWILAREPRISDALRQDLLRRLQARGYRTDALHWTAHPPA